MKWQVVITPVALGMLAEISDQRVKHKIIAVIDRLSTDPEKQGKPLSGFLKGLRSIRAVGQRYRVIFKVEHHQVTVVILAIGIRRQGTRTDIYKLAKKLFEAGLLDRRD